MGILLSTLQLLFGNSEEAVEQMSSCIAWVGDNWICNDGTMCVISMCVTMAVLSIPVMMVIP